MNTIRLKTFSTLLVLASLVFLNSCGGNKGEATSDAAATGETSSMLDETASGAGNAENGKVLFDKACIACHKLTDEKVIGPGLKGVTAKRTEDWIKNMIKDPTNWVINDPDAKALFEEYGKVPMTPMAVLTDADINDVYAYLQQNDAQ
jgi:cytochrome c551/c552